MTLELRVAGLGGPLCIVSVQATSTLQELKAAIQASVGAHPLAQRLFLGTQELIDSSFAVSELLSEYTHDKGLTLVRRTQEELMLELRVATLLGRVLCTVHVHAASTPLDLKAHIEASTGISAAAQRLYTGDMNQELVGGRTLGELLAGYPLEKGLLLRRRSPEYPMWLAELAQLEGDQVLDWLRNSTSEVNRDEGVVRAAVKREPQAFELAPAGLQSDRDFVLEVVAGHGRSLRHASAAIRDDRVVVMAAVDNDGSALQYASARLRADRDVVLTAIAQDQRALSYASAELQAECASQRGAKRIRRA